MSEKDIDITECIRRVERGESFEEVVKEVGILILEGLIGRGHNTAKKLSKVLRKSEVATRQALCAREMSIVSIRNGSKL